MGHKKSHNQKPDWRIDVHIDEHPDRTHASVELHFGDSILVGAGRTRLDPDDAFPDSIATELAVARALSDLTRKLFAATASDVESVTGEPVSVR